MSLLIVRYQILSWIQVLNCQNCNQCLKCHKSPGLSFQLSKIISIISVVFLLLLTEWITCMLYVQSRYARPKRWFTFIKQLTKSGDVVEAPFTVLDHRQDLNWMQRTFEVWIGNNFPPKVENVENIKFDLWLDPTLGIDLNCLQRTSEVRHSSSEDKSNIRTTFSFVGWKVDFAISSFSDVCLYQMLAVHNAFYLCPMSQSLQLGPSCPS